jgi:hypothetical protein
MIATVAVTMASQIAEACFSDELNLILTEPALLSKLNPLVGWMDRWRAVRSITMASSTIIVLSR